MIFLFLLTILILILMLPGEIRICKAVYWYVLFPIYMLCVGMFVMWREDVRKAWRT